MSTAIFDSCARTAGDLAGVFEQDDDTGYFYLYEVDSPAGARVVDSILILSGVPDFGEVDVAVRWDLGEERVGLFIRDVLWAVFDARSSRKYGGGYSIGTTPALPPEASDGFDVRSSDG